MVGWKFVCIGKSVSDSSSRCSSQHFKTIEELSLHVHIIFDHECNVCEPGFAKGVPCLQEYLLPGWSSYGMQIGTLSMNFVPVKQIEARFGDINGTTG